MSQCKYCGEEVVGCEGCQGMSKERADQILKETADHYMKGGRNKRAIIFGVLEGNDMSWCTLGMLENVTDMITGGLAVMLAKTFEPRAAKGIAKKVCRKLMRHTREKCRELREEYGV